VTEAVVTGLMLVLAAGILQGIFLLPMDRTRAWHWEQSWLAFSFFGMLAFNWLFTLTTIPAIFDVYRLSPMGDLARLALFGLGWGLGAVLFGLGMARLGLALGYPIIMGLIASLGALVPLILFFPQTLLSPKGTLIAAGTCVVLVGIVLCSRAAGRKAATGPGQRSGIASGIVIAIAAGILSSLPNIGMAFATRVIAVAQTHGVSANLAANAVWALFFSAGFLVNAAYCLYLMLRQGTAGLLWRASTPGNLFLTALMGLFWIGSFYAYGIGAARLGPLGPVIGWPLFITCSICIGNLVGLWRGEWREAPQAARRLLTRGLLVLLSAVALIAISGALP
jgi:L-rhamnose-H+ transport protein